MATMLHSSGSSLIFKASLLSRPDLFNYDVPDAGNNLNFTFYHDHDDRDAGLRVGPELTPAPTPAPVTAPVTMRNGSVPRTSSLLPALRCNARGQDDNTCNSSTAFKLDSYLDFLTDHSLGIRQFRMSSTTDTPNPMAGLPDPPAVSCKTIAVTGILVDVYGLDELPPGATHISVVWLHNPRLGDRSRMAPVAKRMVGEYNNNNNNNNKTPKSNTTTTGTTRGLIAAAFDQRNHGSREVHHLANLAWNQANATHAQDMFGIVSGTVVDTRLLIDALPGYLFLDRTSPSSLPPVFDQHLACGVSLGGHSTWQTLFADPRVAAGVSIIGCPDFQLLMRDRARLSRRAAYDRDGTHPATADGAAFLGSGDFPPALVAQCAQFDPKGIMFGTGDVVESPSPEQQARLRPVLDRHVRGKKFLLCSGGDDKLVPWRCSEAFTRFFEGAAAGWYKDSGLSVDNRVYPGVGHECSDEMVVDAVRFVCDVVNGAEGGAGTVGSKI